MSRGCRWESRARFLATSKLPYSNLIDSQTGQWGVIGCSWWRLVYWRMFCVGRGRVHGGSQVGDYCHRTTSLWDSRDCSVSFVLCFEGYQTHCWRSSIYGHIDFLGKGATSLLEDVRYHFKLAVFRTWSTGPVPICCAGTGGTSRASFLFPFGRMAWSSTNAARPAKDVWQLHRKWLYSQSHRTVWKLYKSFNCPW